MVSTLYKFPWAATQTYTVAARETLFRTAHKLLSILSQKVFAASDATGRYQREVGLSWALLHDLTYTSIRAPFSLSQKAALLRASGPFGDTVREVAWFAASWPFQTIVPYDNFNDDVLKYWLELFDSGYEVMQEEHQRTPHERYMFVKRNDDGYPVTEWTDEGLMLSMEAGIRMESDVMMTYISRARGTPAKDKGLQIDEWESETFLRLMNSIAEEKDAGQKSTTMQRESPSRKNSNISPTTTGFDQQLDLVNNMGIPARTNVVSQPDCFSINQATSQRFNPATSKDFVPAVVSSSSTTAPAVSNTIDTIKSIWNPPTEPAATNVTNTNINQRNLSQAAMADARPVLRNPFDTGSANDQIFSQDTLPGNVPTMTWHEFMNPFQQKKTSDSDMMSLPVDSCYKTPHRDGKLQDSSISRRGSTSSIGHSMRQLSLETASRNNSTDNALTTANTSTSSLYRNPSVINNELGSPTQKFVQKYPNLTYSSARPNYVNAQTGLDQYIPRNSAIQGQVQGCVTSAISPSGLPDHSSSSAKARAHSTPFGAVGEPISGDVDPYFSREKSETHRPSGMAATSTVGDGKPSACLQSNSGNVSLSGGRQGRLSAGELWKRLSTSN